MSLVKIYSAYGDFSVERYFLKEYNSLCSIIKLEVNIASKSENYKNIVNSIHKNSKTELTEVFKSWNTKDTSDAERTNDFVETLLLKSKDKELLLYLTLENDTLEIQFLYNLKEPNLENLVLELNHNLRQNFGQSSGPELKVLVYRHGYFVEKVRTEAIEVNVSKNYNDDFVEVSSIIDNAIIGDKSGMILLHGSPGTGKTTYIKSLITKHNDYSFLFVKNEFVEKLLDPEFISFLLKQRNTIIVIEDAEKVIKSRETEDSSSVVSTILQLTDGLLSDYLNLKVICTFNTNISKVDRALLRKGRLIALYEFSPLSAEKTAELLKELNIEGKGGSLTLSDIYHYNKKGFLPNKSTKIGF